MMARLFQSDLPLTRGNRHHQGRCRLPPSKVWRFGCFPMGLPIPKRRRKSSPSGPLRYHAKCLCNKMSFFGREQLPYICACAACNALSHVSAPYLNGANHRVPLLRLLLRTCRRSGAVTSPLSPGTECSHIPGSIAFVDEDLRCDVDAQVCRRSGYLSG